MVAPSSAIQKLARLERRRVAQRGWTDRAGDRLVACAGSGLFSAIHAGWFGGWILINSGLLPGVPVFDPYPFSFLTMVVSLEAIFITLAVLHRQNRMSRDSDRRGQLDLVVNLLAERESTVTMRMLERISEHLSVRVADLTEPELADETDMERLLAELDAKVPTH